VDTTELYIPLEQGVDVEAEIRNLENDLKYQKGFLQAIEKKLSNEKFVSNAPPSVVENERKNKGTPGPGSV
jgi:valyl-tRNA synthetase